MDNIGLMWQGKLLVFLEACYYYYILNENIMDDYEFDELCFDLYNNFDVYKNMYLCKDLIINNSIEKDMFKCGTGYSLKYSKELVDMYERNK